MGRLSTRLSSRAWVSASIQCRSSALQQALGDLGLPEDLVTEIEGRLHSQHKLLGKIVGVMCPPPVRVPHEHRTVPRAGLGEKPPVASAQRAAQTVLDQATPTLGSGSAGPAVALCRQQE